MKSNKMRFVIFLPILAVIIIYIAVVNHYANKTHAKIESILIGSLGAASGQEQYYMKMNNNGFGSDEIGVGTIWYFLHQNQLPDWNITDYEALPEGNHFHVAVTVRYAIPFTLGLLHSSIQAEYNR